MSKKITIANSEVISNSQTGVVDSFYGALGSWEEESKNLVFKRKSNLPIKIIADKVEVINTSKTSSVLESGYKVTLTIEPTDATKAASLMGNIALNERFYDHSAQVVVPDSKADVVRNNEFSNIPAKPNVAAEYTFIRENIEYDELVSSVEDEVFLLNYYEPRIRNVRNKNSYVKMAKNVLEQSADQREAYRNIFVPPESVQDIEDNNSLLDDTSQYSYELEDLDYTSEIPFLVRLKLKDTNSDIEQKQDFVKLGNNFLFYANTEMRDPEGDIGSLLMRWHLQNADSFIGSSPFSYTDGGDDVERENLMNYSFLGWLNDFAPARVGDLPNNIEAIKFFTTEVPSLNLAVNNYDSIINFTKTLNRFATKYTEEYLNSTSTKRIEDVLAGIPGKTEILYYKIDKYEGSTPTGTPVQTILVPNTKENVEYFDTQVIYGKDYTYDIRYVVAIHGCEYEYTSVNKNSDGTYTLEVNSYPSIQVVELPVFLGAGTPLAQPPLSPRVEIVPIRRQQNKVKVIFYSGYGNEQQEPIFLTDQDRANNSKILTNTYLTSNNAMINYTSFSTVSQFEVYSSQQRPTDVMNYAPFVNKLFATTSTKSESSGLLADSAAIVMELKTNQKYYFTFVSRNRLGLASNPTKVFEIMYTNQEGISRLHFEELVPETREDTRRQTKTLTKLINIKPTFSQATLNLVESGLADSDGNLQPSRNKNIHLGITEDNMFGPPGNGKKFKFRFRSRKTNKVFDINVTCVNSKVQTEFDRTSDSISLALDEVPQTPQPETNLLYGAVELPAINISNFKNYDILEDIAITSRLKRVVPIGETQQVLRDPIASQSEQINDIFPINN